MKRFDIGEKVSLKVVVVSAGTVFLDLNAKSEGVLDASEFTDENGVCSVHPGDMLDVYFIGNEKGEARFTTKISGGKADKSILENAYKNGIPVEGHVDKEIKGGYEVTVGTSRAFCPYSQMGWKQKGDAASFVGKHLIFKIQEYKNDGRDILVSNRAVMEEAHEKELEALKGKLKEGMTIEATVVSLQTYGAFVDIGGFEALLPISEIVRSRVDDVSSVLHVGQKLDVKIIKTDWTHERVSVSAKELLADPWEAAAEKYTAGSKYEGAVSRVAPFGVFVELEPGVDGLVHISEMDGVDSHTNLSKVFSKGQKMSVLVKEVNARERRISLTPTTSVEQDKTTARYMSSQTDGEGYNPFASLLRK